MGSSAYGPPPPGSMQIAESIAAGSLYGTESQMDFGPSPSSAYGEGFHTSQHRGLPGTNPYPDSPIPRGIGLLQHADGRSLHHHSYANQSHEQHDRPTHTNHHHHQQQPLRQYPLERERCKKDELDELDDRGSDASYYARRPKLYRSRSGSALSSSSESSDGRMSVLSQRRSATLPQHRQSHGQSHRSPSFGQAHSPITPSPLSLASRVPVPERKGHQTSSSVDARENHTRERRRRLSVDVLPDERRRQRRLSVDAAEDGDIKARHRFSSMNGRQEDDKRSRNGEANYYEEVRQGHQYQEQQQPPEHHRQDHYPPPPPSSHLLSPPSPYRSLTSPTRHRHRSTSEIPFPTARFPSPTPSSRYLAVPNESLSQLRITIPRRRAVTMNHEQQQQQHHRSPRSPSHYEPRSAQPMMGYAGSEGGDGFNDGASMAASHMTFMDGSMGGRTSQYGLPKYPHIVKPDYRRFCVQRGTADVFLD
ncbi:hypothetical protein BCR39DRAFT_518756 [Naematelia encephala]|uniref:Uncharacterized protein n=1 Tax=Naematelia encephala TaxID=71784 RepID=A0A1Y2BG72_9TREE|nr:hypothetical protein BCR39DRAFT_518756 [Naematelia encephala]